ncbi:BspA family leucine-rich repeat surface protein [Bifidobacterium sp. ESL0775]|uniref:BspA family leucine-rich repeat surface protein n=1 Tax=Bifidobacterium sp. ESL0775 TaxID=2983230 RepID=UPI0032AF28BF
MTTTGKITLPSSAESMFEGDTNLKSVDASGWDTSRTTWMDSMFYGCSQLSGLNLSGWDVHAISAPNMFSGAVLDSVTARNWRVGSNIGMVKAFNVSGLSKLDLSSCTFDTSLTSLGAMFMNMSGLTYVDVSGWDTSHITDMGNMFNGDGNLTAITGLHDWDTGKVTNMGSMFSGCRSLASLDVSHFDTSNVQTMIRMFQNCAKLVTLDVTDFNTSKVTNMDTMFGDMPKLTVLDPSGFDMHGITSTANLFRNDTNLKKLDLSGWDLRNDTHGQQGTLPTGLRMLALGPNTKLYDTNSFSNVSRSINWVQTDGFQPGATLTGWNGLTPALATKAASADRAGYYVDEKYVGATVIADANGGTGSDIQEFNTWDTTQTVAAPAANKLTGHKPHAVFTGWNTCRAGGTTGGCTPYAPGQTIVSLERGKYFPQQNIVLYAQWRDVDAPAGLTIAYHHHAGGGTVDVAGTAAHAGTVETCLAPGQCQTAITSGGSWSISFTDSTFTTQYPAGSQYTLTTHITDRDTDPVTNQPVISPDVLLEGTLPYMATTLATDGAATPVGSVPDVPTALIDADDAKAYPILPRLAASGGINVDGGYLTGWHHLAGKTTAEFTTPGETGIPAADGTTSGKRTTVTLHPVWRTLNTPTGTGQRSPTDNSVRFTTTGKPWTTNDTITLCVKPRTQAAYQPGDCATPKTTSDWDGASDYTTNHDYTKEQMPQGGDYDIKTTLSTPSVTDTWRGDGTTQTGAITKTSTTTTHISGIYLSSLPLTGGQPQRLAALLAAGLAMALLLLAGADWLRHQRQTNTRHSR